MEPVCPYCKSHDIVELDTVIVEYPVEFVYSDGELEYNNDTASEVDWDTAAPIDEPDQYECKDCRKSFTLKQLVKASLKAAPKWLQRWIKQGDDMRCPQCRRKQIKSQDGVTLCLHCGWQAENPEMR